MANIIYINLAKLIQQGPDKFSYLDYLGSVFCDSY